VKGLVPAFKVLCLPHGVGCRHKANEVKGLVPAFKVLCLPHGVGCRHKANDVKDLLPASKGLVLASNSMGCLLECTVYGYVIKTVSLSRLSPLTVKSPKNAEQDTEL